VRKLTVTAETELILNKWQCICRHNSRRSQVAFGSTFFLMWRA